MLCRSAVVALVVALVPCSGCDAIESDSSRESAPIQGQGPGLAKLPQRQAAKQKARDAEDAQLDAHPQVPAAPAATPTVRPPAGAPTSFAELAQQSDPAVVFVRTVTASGRGWRRQLREGAGSGFVFDASGRILTNYHVVERAHAIQVELNDGRVLEAKVVGADPHTDVAVLSVPAVDLPVLPLGDSDRVRVGDWVMAIGNPFGLEHTVSAGIISAKERTTSDVQLKNPGAYYSFLQTDASINPGNSGGPLIDMSGQVVGMNTAINASANNIGFAIPVNMLRELLPRLLRDGIVQRAALGLQLSDVTVEARQYLNLPDRKGALVVKVIGRSPAARAGFEPGDVVVRFDERPIESPEQLRWRASLSSVGDPVSVVVRRDGKEVTLTPEPVAMR